MGQITLKLASVGDRVTSCHNIGKSGKTGQIGTIIKVAREDYCIQFDEDIGGHDGQDGMGTGKPGHCWWLFAPGFNLIPNDWDN